MKKNLSFKVLGIMCLATFLQTAPLIFAQDDEFGLESGSLDNSEKTETEIIDALCQKLIDEKVFKKGSEKFKGKILPGDFNENKLDANTDPFKPVITKNVPPPARAVQPVKPVKVEPPKPQAPKIQPIKLFVKGIVGNEGNRLAIVEFEKEEKTITKDQIVDGKFKVVDIYSDRVVVYSNKEQRRHTFKIGGDEKEK